MKFSYRGVSYEKQNAILEVTTGEVAGKYRGHDWQYHYPRHIPQIKPKLYLQYRGVAYSTSGLPLKQTEKHPQLCTLPMSKIKATVEDDLKSIHLENMRRNLERRLQVAKESGDANLVNLLEQEFRQLAFN